MGLCPECLMKAGFPSETAAASSRRAFAAPEPAELAPHFPQLEILGMIGQGGMGAVYRARQPSLDRIVALKILPKRPDADVGFAERFAREARALARLSHPHIVAVHDYGEAGGFPYLIMEFVDGVSLRGLLGTGRIGAREALAIVPQVCDALQYAHDQGVVHRDIKPENILLGKDGVVKIADFGLAKLADGGDATLTGAGEVMGTPHYMAPEQVEHPREVDHRADIYSLGVVFYQMLTGELPLGRFGPPSQKVHIDVRLDEVVLRALEKEPERRYQQASILKTAVETVASVPDAPAQTIPRRWRKLAVFGGVGAALALIAAAVVLRFWSGTATATVISGTVIDASTGRPIAHARVADNIYHASPNQAPHEAWTDEHGRFALRTWYEEHTIAASSPGYDTSIQTLFTKILRRESEVRMDFRLTPGAGAPGRDAAFQPIVERLIGDIATHAAPELISFETGQLVFQHDVLGKDAAGQTAASVAEKFRSRGIDATGTLDSTTRGLAGWELCALPLDAKMFDRLGASELQAAFNGCQPGSPVVMAGTGPLPATYAIKLRTGRLGLLQIVGFSDQPRGVRIRYKLVAAGFPPVSAPPQTAPSDDLSAARAELAVLRNRYTDAHPAVAAQLARVRALAAAGGTSAAPTGPTASPPTDFDRMESNPEILRLRLQQAENARANIEAQYQAGVVDTAARDEARTAVTLLQARLANDRVRFATAALDCARRRRERIEERFNVGLADSSARDEAATDLKIAEIRLREAKAASGQEIGR